MKFVCRLNKRTTLLLIFKFIWSFDELTHLGEKCCENGTVVLRENPQGVGFFLTSLENLVPHEKKTHPQNVVLPVRFIELRKTPGGVGFFSD